ncbi:hypothetical protein V7S43_006966 [Phytophthora oleae]|uniref:Uncharacterized protein n=1 Tax=Phytophthora oleae TaxID=2107226 RepID=A0ABD3FMH0_9STRA
MGKLAGEVLQTKLSENYLIDPVGLDTGTVHSPAQLEIIAAVLRKLSSVHIPVIGGELYEQLVRIYQNEGEAK